MRLATVRASRVCSTDTSRNKILRTVKVKKRPGDFSSGLLLVFR
jgi:hypothetical protein